MQLNIELPDPLAVEVEAQARASGTSVESLIEQAMRHQMMKSAESSGPLKSGYGMLAEFGPGPTAEEIDELRREMWKGFGEKV